MQKPTRNIIKKRFIAGAVCPECQATDRIVVETALETSAGGADAPELSRRRCVACGFADEFSDAARTGAQAIPKGRPERPKLDPAATTAVKILDPKSIRSKSPDQL